MYLGIEIGGTKLQLGVGHGDGAEFVAFERRDIDRAQGARGILNQIRETGRELIAAHDVQRVGFGFGGPVFGDRGIVQTSHQVSGWDGFPLAEWCRTELGRPAVLGNDCDSACLAEACFGAGRGLRTVFYVTVGTGIGGGLVIDRRIHGTDRPAAAEVGHLRPGLACSDAHDTVESRAAGPGIEQAARQWVAEHADEQDAEDLLNRAGRDIQQLSSRLVATAAASGNIAAREVYGRAVDVLGWAVAQVGTLIAPDAVIVGGGVSLAGDELFFEPLRAAVDRYLFPPLRGAFEVVPAGLGESVVVHGALALAATAR